MKKQLNEEMSSPNIDNSLKFHDLSEILSSKTDQTSHRNFSSHEIKTLNGLVEKYKDIIYCKKTNAIVNAEKDKTWQKLAEEFNNVPGVSKRTTTQLKNRYKNMKRKKESEPSQLSATGRESPCLSALDDNSKISNFDDSLQTISDKIDKSCYCNFSPHEIETLTHLLIKHKDTICSQKNGLFFNAKREKTWQKLTEEFNNVHGVTKRTVKQLRGRYKNMRKKEFKPDQLSVTKRGSLCQSARDDSSKASNFDDALKIHFCCRKSARCNFSFFEVETLTRLVMKYSDIINSKKTNFVMNAKKEETWEKLAEEFNAVPGVTKRTVKSLKFRYKNMKRKKELDKVLSLMEKGAICQASLDDQLVVLETLVQPLQDPNDGDSSFELAINNFQDEGTALDGVSSVDEVITDKPQLGDVSETKALEEASNPPPPSTSSSEPREEAFNLPPPSTGSNEPQEEASTQIRRPKRKAKASKAFTDYSHARRRAVEAESAQIMEHREKEHQATLDSMKLKDDFMREEHDLKMKVLREKLHYYQLLTVKLEKEQR